ncbi:energy transducer TonB [Steroidobacter flavus]|uniref:Energy transducer TonB n=1 Tax=Steroidobacter flavus TaxID=1842136 RepID=A0ABV8T3N4_9GAMM
MTTPGITPNFPVPPPPPRRRIPVGLLLVLAGIAFVIGFFVLNRGEPPVPKQYVTQQITVLPPPPPPPPPQEEKLPEPEKIIEPKQEAEVQQDVQEVSETPSPEPSTDLAAGLNRAADIGADSFHLAAGKGGGMFGRGGGGGSWDAFVATHVRRALRADPRTSTASGYLEVLFVIDPNGKFERAELQSSTGNKELDAAIRDVLSRLPALSRGRPANVKPLMVTGINIRATQD